MVYGLGKEFGMNVPSMRREWWGAAPPRWVDALAEVPVPYVRLTHTGTPRCVNKESCCEHLRQIQQFYIDEIGLPDIPYNFMVGADGLVYKGRGWYNEASRPPDLDWLKGKCIDIAFIGNHTYYMPDERIMQRALDLIKYGVKGGKIHPEYTLIPLGDATLKT